MPNSEDPIAKPDKHDLESVWVNIRATQQAVASIGSKLDTMVDSVNRLMNKPQRETNWVGIGSLLVALILVVGTYVQARFEPIEAVVAKHDTQILAELEASAQHRYNAGERNGKLSAMETVVTEFIRTTNERVLELEHDTASMRATQVGVVQWLGDVDHIGSRKWIGKSSAGERNERINQ